MEYKEEVLRIHTMIRLQQEGYQNVRCPCCMEKPYVDREPNFLLIRCKCGLLNMSERGI